MYNDVPLSFSRQYYNALLNKKGNVHSVYFGELSFMKGMVQV